MWTCMQAVQTAGACVVDRYGTCGTWHMCRRQVWLPHLLQAGQQEGLQPGKACTGTHAGNVLEEARAQLPCTVVQEGDHGWQQKVIGRPASHGAGRASCAHHFHMSIWNAMRPQARLLSCLAKQSMVTSAGHLRCTSSYLHAGTELMRMIKYDSKAVLHVIWETCVLVAAAYTVTALCLSSSMPASFHASYNRIGHSQAMPAQACVVLSRECVPAAQELC